MFTSALPCKEEEGQRPRCAVSASLPTMFVKTDTAGLSVVVGVWGLLVEADAVLVDVVEGGDEKITRTAPVIP